MQAKKSPAVLSWAMLATTLLSFTFFCLSVVAFSSCCLWWKFSTSLVSLFLPLHSKVGFFSDSVSLLLPYSLQKLLKDAVITESITFSISCWSRWNYFQVLAKFVRFGGAGAQAEGVVSKPLVLTGFSSLTIFVWWCQQVSEPQRKHLRRSFSTALASIGITSADWLGFYHNSR